MKAMTLIEQVAHELCRWQYSQWVVLDAGDKATYRREARKLVKMVCGSCGLAKPLRESNGWVRYSKEGEKDA